MKKLEMVNVSFRMSMDRAQTLSSLIDLDQQSDDKEVREVSGIVQRAIQRGIFIAVANRKP